MLKSAATLPASGSGYYHHHDALGNVVALTNAASCAVLETYTYDPFGKRTVYNATGQQIPDTAYANTHGYTGREHLPLRGLMDYRNRSYSTTLGRFLQTDPIRFDAGDVNLYRYVGNNSINYVHPTGKITGIPFAINEFLKLMDPSDGKYDPKNYPRKNHDKAAHCVAHCMIGRGSPWHWTLPLTSPLLNALTSLASGFAKEVFDDITDKMGLIKAGGGFDPDDIKANLDGLLCAYSLESCECCCDKKHPK